LTEISALSEEQRFQLLVNAVTDYAIYMLDADGRIASWNPGAQRFKQYSAAEIIGQHFSRFFADEDRARDLPGSILRTAADEGRFEGEGWRVRKDGSTFFAHVVVDAIRGEDGELLGFAKITRDVTERHERDRALYESEQRFRMLVEGVVDYAIYMLDPDGRVSNWNSGAQIIKGYTADEIVGEHFSRFYTDEDRASGEPQRALETALKEGKYEREAWRVRKDGSLFWANVVIDPIYNEKGEHVGFAKITRDATERKKAQDALDETRAALAQSQKLQALGELTGGIAHDFNNLMTVIAGSTDYLLQRPDLPAAKRTQYLAAIGDTAARAMALTNQLLAFGRRQAIKPEVIAINVRLDALAEVLSRTIGSRFDIRLELAPVLPHVEVDSAQLETALLNVAINARDAMPDGGRLTIATSEVVEDDRHYVRIAVTDTGTGMPREVLDRAFEPFFTTKALGKGTGLGLSQIHGFAAQAGGRAEIQSAEGHGTTVSLLLPISDKALNAKPEAGELAEIPKGLWVLLVEDSPQVREFAQELLADLHCNVVAAASGEEALRRLEEQPVDLVFSDVVMPGMSGVELAKAVQERKPGLPILLATGYSEDVLKNRPEFTLLSKPYRLQELSAAIAAELNKHREQVA
jgi:PAS domain S-box-containing protein